MKETAKKRWVYIHAGLAAKDGETGPDGTLGFPQLQAQIRWERFVLPAKMEIVPFMDTEQPFRCSRVVFRLIGARNAYAAYSAKGSAVLIPERIRLEPDRPVYTLELPPSFQDGLSAQILYVETDESCLNRRVHKLEFPSPPRILCYPSVLFWKEAGQTISFGVVRNGGNPMDLHVTLPSSLAPDCVQPTGSADYVIRLPAPPTQWRADKILLRDRLTGAVGAIPILVMHT